MTPRHLSLDVFRGAAVALMILVNNPGSWNHLYPPLAHAPWHGCTPTDLVFPFFLFAVGNALALVMPRLLAGPAAAFWVKLVRRTALVFLIGLLLNAVSLWRWDAQGGLSLRGLEQLRTLGVLQRIALCWGAAALIVWWARGRAGVVAGVAAALLLAYWALCLGLATGADPYSLEGFFGTHWDRTVLGASHLYQGEGVPFDPEGLASTLPAVAQVLLGALVGQAMARHGSSAGLVARLFMAATALLALAYLWQLAMPLNKKIWTSSYVVLTTGLALLLLATLMLLLDVQGRRGAWVRFFEVFGTNALFIFVLSGLVPRLLGLLRWGDGVAADGTPRFITPLPWIHRTLFAGIGSDPRLGSLLFALANLALYWVVARELHRRRIFLRV